MKQKITLALATIMAVGISSCSEDENVMSNQNTRAITFDVPFVSKSTRALVDNSNITSQSLKVWAQKTPTGEKTWSSVFDGTVLSYSNSKWTPASTAYWYEYQDYRFVAACPSSAPFTYDESTGFLTLTSVPAVQEASAGTDYLVSNQYTTTTASQDREAVSLTMTHMMSKITMGIKKTSDYSVRVNSSKLWLPKDDIKVTYTGDAANMDRSDAHCWTYASFTNGGDAPSDDYYKQYTCFGDEKLTLATTVTNGSTYLVAPHAALAMYIDLDFDVLDENGNILRNKKIEKMAIERKDPMLLSNTSYNIVININADDYVDEIQFNNVTVNDWNTGYYITCTTTGEVTFTVDGEKYTVGEGENQKISLGYVSPSSFSVTSGVANLTAVNASHLDVSNITDMNSMFWGCPNLKALDLSGWNTANVTDMAGMFNGCQFLEFPDLSGWDTSNVTDMAGMFWGCRNLSKIKGIENWNTRNVTNMSEMFVYCRSLTSLDLSGWDVSNVTDMCDMFARCENLQSLDLSGWNTRNVTNISEMFYNNPQLTQIIAKECDETTISALESAKPSSCTLITE